MKFDFIDREKATFSVPFMCKHLGVSTSGYYDWRKRRGCPDLRKCENEAELVAAVQRLHRQYPAAGRPRLRELLRREGLSVSGNRLRRIMLELGVSGRPGRKATRPRSPQPLSPVAPNLLERKFAIDRINTVWTGDITEFKVKTAKLYLAITLDLASRSVVGWKLDTQMKTEIITSALRMGLERRNPARGLIFHSDQGVQYRSKRFQQMLHIMGIRQSMSRRGNCWDNAPTESFFATLKKELLYARTWSSRDELEVAIADYIDHYNNERIHTSLGMRSPREYEQDHAA